MRKVYANPQSKVGNMRSPGFSCQNPSQNFPWCPKRFPQDKTGWIFGRNPGGNGMLGRLSPGAPELGPASDRGGPEHILHLDRLKRIGPGAQ